MGGFAEYDKYDAVGLAELVRKKQVQPSELVEEAIGRIERVNPQINAVIHKMYDYARKTAQGHVPDGPFKGVPFLLKDLVNAFAGVPFSSGSRFLKDYVPDFDSELVKRYKAAGLIILGKTNTPEFGLMPVTEPELFGPCNNPWDLGRTAGGSSGGSAAAVAARIVPMADGNDGGGSLRMPASCCGIFAMKPTRGRTPLGPEYAEGWHGLLCCHALSVSVRDSAALLDAVAGPDIGAPYYAAPPSRPFLAEVDAGPGKLRIAYTARPFVPAKVHQDCLKGLEETVRLCRDLGHDVEEAALEVDGPAFQRAFMTMVCGATMATIRGDEVRLKRKATSRDFETGTWLVALLAKQYSSDVYARAIDSLKLTGRQVGALFQKYDVLLTPTLGAPPLATGVLSPKGMLLVAAKVMARLNAGRMFKTSGSMDAMGDQLFSFMPFTPLFNATGHPAMSVPLHWNETGLPIGMQFVGRFGDETTLFRLAGQLEKAKTWSARVPPVCAMNK